jgi:glutathione S-transferase
MEAGHEQGTGTRDLASGGGPVEPVIDDGRDRGETPVGVVDDGDPPHDEDAALLPADEDAGFQRRWQELQASFVDEPRSTVDRADELVAQVMQRVAEGFATEREHLERQWGRGEDVSTEDLRVALQRYRAFFRRLLSA